MYFDDDTRSNYGGGTKKKKKVRVKKIKNTYTKLVPNPTHVDKKL